MRRIARIVVSLGASVAFAAMARAAEPSVIFADQGTQWTSSLREAFYSQDQGSRLIPLAWLSALRQRDGTPFLADGLGRYFYLPHGPAARRDALPVGFTVAATDRGPTVGLTCAACHTRDLVVADRTYRIDGGPAFADFGAFVVDLDAAVLRVLSDDAAFAPFADAVLGAKADAARVKTLHLEIAVWSSRFHALVDASVPKTKPWGRRGPTRSV